jgi:hypothetical protein
MNSVLVMLSFSNGTILFLEVLGICLGKKKSELNDERNTLNRYQMSTGVNHKVIRNKSVRTNVHEVEEI